MLSSRVFVRKCVWVQIDFVDCSRWNHNVMSRRRESKHQLQVMSQSQRWTRLKVQVQKLPKVLKQILCCQWGGGDHTGLTTFLCLSWSDLIVFCFHRTSGEEWRQQWNEAWCCCKYTELIGRNSWFSFLSGLWRLTCAHIWLHYLFPHE